MKKLKYLILGAGPSGLTLGRCLADKGEKDFLIIEKENEAGGLCRSKDVDGKPLDIGGGHFLDVRRPAVCDFVFRFLPEKDWNSFDRDSRIRIHGTEINHPFEANIWQLPSEYQDKYLESIKEAGCNTGKEKPVKFKEWIRWKLGDEIAENYMLPYNNKMFGGTLDELGTYWLEKLPNVSYEETLQSCTMHKSFGTQPGHAKFYYPKEYGYGEAFLRIADSMPENIKCGVSVTELDLTAKTVKCSDGEEYCADTIITTIPWGSMKIKGCTEEFENALTELKHSSVEIRYVAEDPQSPAHWVYVPDENTPYHRILCRCNFCPDSEGYWVETVEGRTGAYENSDWKDNYAYMNEYAYPLNTVNKPEKINLIMTEVREKGIIPLGRWGEHEHYNSDVVMERAMNLAETL
ncbi:protoporphyrinogen/coproporphyrinogen oxidase [Butyrivibrio sp. MB2005]|uniref:protoporphyrinogen/coproporphyrinogen oxidase n=1 Tax=Butyrivibrio sp. MB2005 TaxID=1280678 RepID=UPI000417FFF3|nr:FAD-dependent oxidoreductase [Butyrivibrio sp. MB2005]